MCFKLFNYEFNSNLSFVCLVTVIDSFLGLLLQRETLFEIVHLAVNLLAGWLETICHNNLMVAEPGSIPGDHCSSAASNNNLVTRVSQGASWKNYLLRLIFVAVAQKDSLLVFKVLVLGRRLSPVVIKCNGVTLSFMRKKLHTLLLLLLLLLLNGWVVPQYFLCRAWRRFLLRHFTLNSRWNVVRLHIYYCWWVVPSWLVSCNSTCSMASVIHQSCNWIMVCITFLSLHSWKSWIRKKRRGLLGLNTRIILKIIEHWLLTGGW